MGLKIVAFSKAHFIHPNPIGCEICLHLQVYPETGFESRLDSKQPGCYTPGQGGEYFDFEASPSYHGYNNWRNMLSEVILNANCKFVCDNLKLFSDKPFFELINMSDCDGAIGPETSKKLAVDFEGYKDKIEEILAKHTKQFYPAYTDHEKWLEKFHNWHRAFKIASDNGFVIFC